VKRLGGLWPRVTAFENLLAAYRKARRGKSSRPAVARFGLDLERNLFELQRQLLDHSYRPGGYRLFQIYDRKPRTIAAAPFRDRVVHHALMDPIEPLLDRRLIHDCYACRKGKGVHAAVRRFQGWAQRYPYALKIDVQAYFPSMDHALLKRKLRRMIKDPDLLWLFDLLIDSAPPSLEGPRPFPGDDLVDLMEQRGGLPIGNLTSQFFGNLFLNDLDHFVQQHLGITAYLRYVDDMVLLHRDKRRLWEARDAIDGFLQRERLRLHPRKVLLTRVGEGLDLLGYRVFPQHILLRRDNGYRFRRRLRGLARSYGRGDIDLKDVGTSVAAWLGHTRHAQSRRLCAKVLGSVCFVRGAVQDVDPARGSRRRLEQQTGEPPVCQPQQEHHR